MTRLLTVLAAGVTLAACSTGNSAPPAPGNPVNVTAPGYATLEFSAGMLTISGTAPGSAVASGVNLVSTFRHRGTSAVLVDTPTISGPFSFGSGFAATTGNAGLPSSSLNPPGDAFATAFGPTPSTAFVGAPSMLDVSLNQLSGTPQTLHPGAPSCDTSSASAPAGYTSCAGTGLTTPSNTTFGYSGGVFANGLQPANYTQFSKPYTFAPFALPFFATAAPAVTPFEPYGGPPAFDDQKNGLGYRDGQHSSLLGAVTGMTALELPQTASTLSGTYSLSVVVPTGGQSTTAISPVSASVSSAKALPAIATPTLTLDGNGGATVNVPAFPAGVTEEYVYIIDNGPVPASVGSSADANCQGTVFGMNEGPVYYTLVYTAAGSYAPPSTAPTGGATNVGLPDAIGPNINQSGPTTVTGSPSICTGSQNASAVGAGTPGDTYIVVAVGLDYDLYGASVPKSTSQNPTIVGAAGQDDMSISFPVTATSP